MSKKVFVWNNGTFQILIEPQCPTIVALNRGRLENPSVIVKIILMTDAYVSLLLNQGSGFGGFEG